MKISFRFLVAAYRKGPRLSPPLEAPSGISPRLPLNRGFTLLEVLCALAIFAVAAVVLGAAYVNVLLSYSSLDRHGEDSADLQLVRAVVLNEPDRTKIEQGGEVDLPDGSRANWTVTLDDTQVADLFTVHLNCDVSGGKLSDTRSVKQQFTLLRPTWSDPKIRQKLMQDAATRITGTTSTLVGSQNIAGQNRGGSLLNTPGK